MRDFAEDGVTPLLGNSPGSDDTAVELNYANDKSLDLEIEPQLPILKSTFLPDVLPADVLLLLVEHLVESQYLATLASLESTSKTNYDLVSPYLHQKRVLSSTNLSLPAILSATHLKGVKGSATAGGLAEAEQDARRAGWLFGEKGTGLRARINMVHTRELVVSAIPAQHEMEKIPPKRINFKIPMMPLSPVAPLSPASRGSRIVRRLSSFSLSRPLLSSRSNSSSTEDSVGAIPLQHVDTVHILPTAMYDLSQHFSLKLVEQFLRPLSTTCSPTHLILDLPGDSAPGSSKELLSLLDELRWPQLRKLSLVNITDHAIPSRPGLKVDVRFSPSVPHKWTASGRVSRSRQLQKYERSRLTQIVMAIPRSVRIREGSDGLGGMQWSFTLAGHFFGEDNDVKRRLGDESGERLETAVKDWVRREYGGAGWSEDQVEVLLGRITFRSMGREDDQRHHEEKAS